MTHVIVNSGVTRREAEEWSFDWAALDVTSPTDSKNNTRPAETISNALDKCFKTRCWPLDIGALELYLTGQYNSYERPSPRRDLRARYDRCLATIGGIRTYISFALLQIYLAIIYSEFFRIDDSSGERNGS